MRRAIKISLLCLASVIGIVGIGYLILIRSLAGNQQESASEIVLTPKYLQAMRIAGYPITIIQAFQASSYGGWHGDGASLKVYRYPASESDSLLEALKVRSPDYKWSDTISQYASLGHLKDLLPDDFLPSSERTILIEGRPTQGLPLLEYVVCPSEGLYYSISHQF